MQVILRQLGDCDIRRAGPSDLISVMEINLKTLPEHYSDYFYESLLAELPEAFIVAEIGGKHVGYIMCKTEFGFSNFKNRSPPTFKTLVVVFLTIFFSHYYIGYN